MAASPAAVVLCYVPRCAAVAGPALDAGIGKRGRAPADVVSTYKICTIRVGESSDSSRREPPPPAAGSAASGSSAGSQAPAPAPAQQPAEAEAVTALLETWLLMGALW